MKRSFLFSLFFLFLFIQDLASIESNEKPVPIQRKSKDFYYLLQTPHLRKKKPYSWEKEGVSLPKITKEFFRCRGIAQNAPRQIDASKILSDCAGGTKHPLSFVQGKEGVYAVLLDLLNFVQKKTGKQVVITCGHRCSLHNAYADPSKDNLSSKHLIGAEVDFYVKGMEHAPEKIIEIVHEFYRQDPETKNNPEFTKFLRYEKKTNVATPPWYNKEIFLKLFRKEEGRDFDNSHDYPYVSIQVRFDRERKEKVVFSWDLVNNPSI